LPLAWPFRRHGTGREAVVVAETLGVLILSEPGQSNPLAKIPPVRQLRENPPECWNNFGTIQKLLAKLLAIGSSLSQSITAHAVKTGVRERSKPASLGLIKTNLDFLTSHSEVDYSYQVS
jgi:hypothetical protein